MTILRLPLKLLCRDNVYRPVYNFLKGTWDTTSVSGHVIPEVNDWLKETIGFDLLTYRQKDQLLYVDTMSYIRGTLHQDRFIDRDQWDQENPLVPKDKRTWLFIGPTNLYFKRDDHAALFKLRWL